MTTPTNDIDDDHTCDDSTIWPVVIAGGSVLLGYLVGRTSYRRDLRTALRQLEESPDPIEISIRTL